MTGRHVTAAVGKTSLLTALTIKVLRAVLRTRLCRAALNCGGVASTEQDNSGMGRGEQGMEYHKKVPLIGNDGEVRTHVSHRTRTHHRTHTHTHDTRGSHRTRTRHRTRDMFAQMTFGALP
jgi:hypothetical protein